MLRTLLLDPAAKSVRFVEIPVPRESRDELELFGARVAAGANAVDPESYHAVASFFNTSPLLVRTIFVIFYFILYSILNNPQVAPYEISNTFDHDGSMLRRVTFFLFVEKNKIKRMHMQAGGVVPRWRLRRPEGAYARCVHQPSGASLQLLRGEELACDVQQETTESLHAKQLAHPAAAVPRCRSQHLVRVGEPTPVDARLVAHPIRAGPARSRRIELTRHQLERACVCLLRAAGRQKVLLSVQKVVLLRQDVPEGALEGWPQQAVLTYVVSRNHPNRSSTQVAERRRTFTLCAVDFCTPAGRLICSPLFTK